MSVKIAKQIGFCVYHRFYLLQSPVIVDTDHCPLEFVSYGSTPRMRPCIDPQLRAIEEYINTQLAKKDLSFETESPISQSSCFYNARCTSKSETEKEGTPAGWTPRREGLLIVVRGDSDSRITSVSDNAPLQQHDKKQTRGYDGGPSLIGPNIVSKNGEIYTWQVFMYTIGPINYGPP